MMEPATSSSQHGCYRNLNNSTNLRGNNWVTEAEKEHMFDKVVTPSDVGKLNRLVIPKQHAEKYFPLHSSTDLVLTFEDRNAKSWCFRYSYWNSSQSYVMTKGWRRFVKDKKLHAGDIVSFLRSKHAASFFIDWRRRPNHPLPDHHRSASVPWTPLLTYPHHQETLSYLHKEEEVLRGDLDPLMVLGSVPVVEAGAGKKLRLFGVNMEME